MENIFELLFDSIKITKKDYKAVRLEYNIVGFGYSTGKAMHESLSSL